MFALLLHQLFDIVGCCSDDSILSLVSSLVYLKIHAMETKDIDV